MAGADNYSPYVIIGKLSRDFIITPEGEPVSDIPGGHLLYAAIGMTPWERKPGLVARISNNFPESFIDLVLKYGFDTQGLKRVSSDLEQRNFISFYQTTTNSSNRFGQAQKSVLSQYFNIGQPFPKELLGYNPGRNTGTSLTERTNETVLARDIPLGFLEARCIHLCPLDYLSHNLLPQAFSGGEKRTITVQAGNGYMQPHCFEAIKTLVNGLSCFIVREQALRDLFFEKYKISLLSDMMNTLLDYGAENIVVREESGSYCFMNVVDRVFCRLQISDENEPQKIGELSCFCGAYIVGLNETYDYRKAAAYGTARISQLKNDRNPYNNLNIFDALVMEKIRIMESRIEG